MQLHQLDVRLRSIPAVPVMIGPAKAQYEAEVSQNRHRQAPPATVRRVAQSESAGVAGVLISPIPGFSPSSSSPGMRRDVVSARHPDGVTSHQTGGSGIEHRRVARRCLAYASLDGGIPQHHAR